MRDRPLVGLLYNPAVPHVVAAAGSLVESVEVIPDRLWYDFGSDETDRFRRVAEPIETLKRCAEGRTVIGHGIGLSLPSAMPIDEALLDEVAATCADLDMAWYSEHLSMFLVPKGSVPNAQAGLGLPVVYDAESLALLSAKVGHMSAVIGRPLLLENGTIFTPVPDAEMTEPAFLNQLYDATGCGVLLDLHNLYANVVNNAVDPVAYLDELDPAAVVEIHFAGGDELLGFYTDSHSRATPDDVWGWAYRYAGRFPNLRALTFEFHESYFARLTLPGIIAELERLHELADHIAAAEPAVA